MGKKINFEAMVDRCDKLFNGKYEYVESSFINMSTKMKIICPEHGVFLQVPSSHLRGHGCPKCWSKSIAKTQTLTTKIFIEKANAVHNGKYNYANTKYNGCYSDVEIICPIHGSFSQIAYSHLQGHGCPKCSTEKNSIKMIKSNEDFIFESKIKHIGENNDYSLVIYKGVKVPVEIICNKGHHYFQTPNKHLMGHGCPFCAKVVSSSELELREFLASIGITYETSKRTILSSSKELDIYIPSHRIAIEFDGLFWHSSDKRDKNYHLEKTNDCICHNINLIHIFEDEWLFKKEIVKSRLREFFNVFDMEINADDCSIKNVPSKEARVFLDKNDIDGFCKSKIKYGLYHNKELVYMIALSKSNKNGEYKLVGACAKLNTNVVNGLDKLLSHFIKCNYPRSIIYHMDKRWNDSPKYENLGFKYAGNIQPKLFYIKDRHRIKKDVSKNLSKIYDCGYSIYKLNVN